MRILRADSVNFRCFCEITLRPFDTGNNPLKIPYQWLDSWNLTITFIEVNVISKLQVAQKYHLYNKKNDEVSTF